MHAGRRRSSRPAALLLSLFLLLTFTLTGCVRLHAAMAVSEDDRVSGEIVAATPPTQDSDPGPQLKVPQDLTSRRQSFSGSCAWRSRRKTTCSTPTPSSSSG